LLKVTDTRAGLRIGRFPTRASVLHSTENRYIPHLSLSAKNNQERLEHKTFTKNPDFSHSVRK
jgi:hypothetical protein